MSFQDTFVKEQTCSSDFAPCEFTNNSDVIRQNCKMTSINSALEIDLTGQIVSDSIGSRIFSGFAGQVDFMAATPHSFDGAGKAIIALPSRTSSGKSKIVPFLKKVDFPLLSSSISFSGFRSCYYSCSRPIHCYRVWNCSSLGQIYSSTCSSTHQYFTSR